MKKSLSLSLVLSLLLASCTVGDSVDTDDAVITESRAVSDSDTLTTDVTTEAVPTMDDYINGKAPLPAMGELQLLGADMQTKRFDSKNCAVVYNECDAWIFDYELSKVIPTVDLDAMLKRVDPTGRGDRYFEDVSIEYSFKEDDYNIQIVYNVTSNTEHESHFNVDLSYRTYKDEYRGQINAYCINGIVYPGCTEPLTISTVDELDKLFPEIGSYGNFLDVAKAFTENDTRTLEELLYLERGALAAWEGTVIGDYTISRKMPLYGGDSWCTMEFTIESSTIERYPAGRYVMYENLMHKVRLGGEDLCFALPVGASADAIDRAYSWGTMYGGKWTLDEQDTADTGFAHAMLDYLMGIATVNGEYHKFTGNMYREYAEKYLGLKNVNNEYTAYGSRVINHGAHGPNMARGEIVEYRVEDGVHYVTISCYAEDEKTTVTQTHTYSLVEAENGVYAIIDTEEVYESGLPHFGWAV